MRALRFHVFGGPEVMQLEEVDVPRPGRGQVLVDVSAAGLNFADTERRRGLYLADLPLPDVLGFEGAGLVQQLGEGATPSLLGRRVAFLAPRACAERCVVDVERLMQLPDAMDFVEGAAFPVQALTAWHVLHTVGRVQRGERVLVHSAAGGVGQVLVQLAKEAGAFVIGVVSRDAKVDVVRALGADEVVVGRAALPGDVQLVVEGVGGDVGASVLASLAPFGRWVHFGTAAGSALAMTADSLFAKSVTFSSYWLRSPHPVEVWERGVAEVLSRLGDGRLRLQVTTAPLAEAARWHRRLEGALTTGKVVFSLGA